MKSAGEMKVHHLFILFVDFCRGLNIMILPCYMHEDGDKLVLTNYL